MADRDLNAANVGHPGTPGQFDGGIRAVQYPEVTPNPRGQHATRGHSAIITIYEACWLTSTNKQFQKDSAIIMESGDAQATDVHDFASVYGEFLASGNDPTINQLGSIRFGGGHQAGGGIPSGGTVSSFVNN